MIIDDHRSSMERLWLRLIARRLEVVLTPDDIPGAEPYEQHTVAALRWWLLCRYYCPYISIWKVSQKNSCTGFHIILLQIKLFQPRRLSVFLPWNAMEAFFWVGSPTSTTHCASLAWHLARTALYQSCKQTLLSACNTF